MTEPDWSQFPAGGRQATLCRALQRLRELVPGPATIVETGTTRDASEAGRQGDGWSTLAFAWYTSETGGWFSTVDASEESIAVAAEVTDFYSDAVDYVVSDSVKFLQLCYRKSIHFLYLDSLDYHPHQQAESEAHHLAEAEAALPALAPTCLVLIDDTTQNFFHFGGKGALAVPFLIQNGFCVEWCEGGQVLLSRVETPR